MLTIDSEKLVSFLSRNTGVEFKLSQSLERGEAWVDLQLTDNPPANSFIVRLVLGWRHIEVLFKPGNFAGSLLENMKLSPIESRQMFFQLLSDCQHKGADIKFEVNGKRFGVGDAEVWSEEWTNVILRFRVGQAELGSKGPALVEDSIREWVARLVTTVITLMPVEIDNVDAVQEFLPEGARLSIQVNRYERDPRNRAAALAIHGYRCMGCELQLSDLYGEMADGLIEVHHTVPVSKLGGGYKIDPRKDLVSLCPNCHRVVHRSDPPLSVESLKSVIKQLKGK